MTGLGKSLAPAGVAERRPGHVSYHHSDGGHDGAGTDVQVDLSRLATSISVLTGTDANEGHHRFTPAAI